jgi:hypothetical protein
MMTGGCEHLTAREFKERLTAAPPGEVIIYATGFLAVAISDAFINKDPGAGELTQLAKAALMASDSGNAFLTQRRVGPKRFEYRAQKPNGASGQTG